MQKTPPAEPAPPARPVVTIPATSGSGSFTIATPMTARELSVLRAQREELSNQLQSVDGRRNKLLSQLRQLGVTGDETARRGLEDRLALLDKRELQLESDLAETGQKLSSVPAGLFASTSAGALAGGLGSGQVVAISIVSIIFVLGPLAIGFARTIWKRSSKPPLPPAAFTETAQRLERLEVAVDTIALEIERISEGQRFVTKLLSEGQASPLLAAGQRSPETVRSGQ